MGASHVVAKRPARGAGRIDDLLCVRLATIGAIKYNPNSKTISEVEESMFDAGGNKDE